ncbi:hypothetical protein BsWGS_27146 [Bradybaena similaris]
MFINQLLDLQFCQSVAALSYCAEGLEQAVVFATNNPLLPPLFLLDWLPSAFPIFYILLFNCLPLRLIRLSLIISHLHLGFGRSSSRGRRRKTSRRKRSRRKKTDR